METCTEGRQRQSRGDVATSREPLEQKGAGRSLPRGLQSGLILTEPALGTEAASQAARLVCSSCRAALTARASSCPAEGLLTLH